MGHTRGKKNMHLFAVKVPETFRRIDMPRLSTVLLALACILAPALAQDEPPPQDGPKRQVGPVLAAFSPPANGTTQCLLALALRMGIYHELYVF